jgi:hypothetical protein
MIEKIKNLMENRQHLALKAHEQYCPFITTGHVTSHTGRNAVVACNFYHYFIPNGICIKTISENFKTVVI